VRGKEATSPIKLLHRHSSGEFISPLVRMRAQIKGELQHLALNQRCREGHRCGARRTRNHFSRQSRAKPAREWGPSHPTPRLGVRIEESWRSWAESMAGGTKKAKAKPFHSWVIQVEV